MANASNIDQPALDSAGPPRHNLPLELTSFVGREKEILELRGKLTTGAMRLVTLMGTGGVGKSRLALRAAAGLVEFFEDGVFLVELAALSDPGLVPQVVAKELGLRETPGRSASETVQDYLRSKHLLLVLDNCEHLIGASAELAQKLLMVCPRLRLLATTREILGVVGEATVRVSSLSAPGASEKTDVLRVTQYEAVELFIARVRVVSPGFALTEENCGVVAEICRRLDGIPLALELAAARMRVMSVWQIAQRLNDAFLLLTGGGRTALPQHQTLRALIDWSYNLLSTEEQSLLQELSTFAGGWTLEAAEAVGSGGDVLGRLGQLVDKSLVSAGGEEEPRFSMLGTIRQYVQEKWIDSRAENGALSRHLGYFLGLAERVEPELRGRRQIARLALLERELDNLRAAMEWGLQNDLEAELRLVGALMWLWHIHNRREEGLYWLEQGLSRAEAVAIHPGVRAKAFAAAGVQYVMRTELATANAKLQESLSLYRRMGLAGRVGAAFVLSWLSYMEAFAGNVRHGISYAEEALGLYREVNDPGNYSDCLLFLSTNLLEADPYNPRIRELREEYLKLALDAGDPDRTATAYTHLAVLSRREFDLDRARYLYGQAVKIYQQVGNREMVSNYFRNMGFFAMLEGKYAEAVGYLTKAVEDQRDYRTPQYFYPALLRLAEAYMMTADDDSASRCLTESLTCAEQAHLSYEIGSTHLLQARLAWLQGDRQRMELEMDLSRGIQDDLLFTHTLGSIFLVDGDRCRSSKYFKETLFSGGMNERHFGGLAVNGLACIEAYDQPEHAARMFGAAETLNPYLKNLLYPVERVIREAALAALKAVLGAERMAALWEEGRDMPFEAILDWIGHLPPLTE